MKAERLSEPLCAVGTVLVSILMWVIALDGLGVL